MAAFFFHLRKYSYILLLALAVASSTLYGHANEDQRKVHIVYMGALPKGEYSPTTHHIMMLEKVVDASAMNQSLIIRSYTRSFNGFAAYLTEQERQKLADEEGVVSVFPSRIYKPQTTRSWDFMGFPEKPVSRHPTNESNVIIGFIDTGIWPELESFSDEGFGPPPQKWKGACKGGKNFTCNNKIIGARYYTSGPYDNDDSALDRIGHGTHTASTAAGNIVSKASFYGLAEGTARGGSPSARIAAYKVCQPGTGCSSEDILAAFDDAIADGVDIISISLGRDYNVDLDGDTVAIGAFHAVDRGILTVHSAGNSGSLGKGHITSVAPWLLSVAASTTDRRMISKVVLGNGTILVGNAINRFILAGSNFSLVRGINLTTTCDEGSASICQMGCLDSKLVEGKIVVCNDFQGMDTALAAGALGSIVLKDPVYDYPEVVRLPTSVLNSTDINLVQSYMNSTNTPKATILKSESVRDFLAPVVATFSSRGPNTIVPEILKPDITAPGVDILAAYSPAATDTNDPSNPKTRTFNFLSGTSMSCPHAAGSAAYLKSLRPGWSPSAIKSALMTTAWQMNAANNPDAEFGYGAGHIDPVKAAHPGLVYETFKGDYVKMMCEMGFDNSKIGIIVGDHNSSYCSDGAKGSPTELNYPTMAAPVVTTSPFTFKFPRTVTNVGFPNSTYKAEISPMGSINISVEPGILIFKEKKEKKSFVVTVSGGGFKETTSVFASLVWSDGTHSVRSPIVVYTTSSFPS